MPVASNSETYIYAYTARSNLRRNLSLLVLQELGSVDLDCKFILIHVLFRTKVVQSFPVFSAMISINDGIGGVVMSSAPSSI